MKILFSLILLLSFNFSALSQKKNKVIQVNSSEFKQLIEAGGEILLDVRTRAEYENQHIAQTNFLDFYQKGFGNKLMTLPRDRKILLYCNSGHRSDITGKFLVKNGYTEVYNLQHGIIEWNLAKLPTVSKNSKLLKQENIYSTQKYLETIAKDSLIFVDFYAEWCGPCKTMMPLIDSLKTEYHGKVKIIKVNSDLSKELMQKLQVKSVPFFLLYRNNKLIFSKYGILTRKEIEDKFSLELNQTSKIKSKIQE